jgi:hypothetical protein
MNTECADTRLRIIIVARYAWHAADGCAASRRLSPQARRDVKERLTAVRRGHALRGDRLIAVAVVALSAARAMHRARGYICASFRR